LSNWYEIKLRQQCDLHRVRINDAGGAGHAGDVVPGGGKFAGGVLLPRLVARVAYLTTIGSHGLTMNRNVDKIHTTIGALVVALSDAAFEVCAEKRDAYLLVALALKRLLGRAQLDRSPIAAQLLAAYPSPLVVARSAPEPIQPFNSSTCS